MVDCTRMNNLVLVALLLSFVCDNAASFGTPKTPCSWGAWSQWNCTCCGNSIDQPVYRVRTKCCSGTFACGNLRIMAEYITSSGTNFQEEGKCSKDCPITDFKKHNSNSCSSAVDQTLLLAKPALCQDVCIGSLTTTKSSLPSRTQPPYTTITHRDSTRVTAADVRSSTDIPSNSSRDTVPPETTNDRNRPCFGTTTTKCSWGTWSQWICNCCGNSLDQPVYRVRTQCCPGTFACESLHIMAEKITSSETDLDEGTCMHDCKNAYIYNINKCRSVVPTNERNSLSNAPASCHHVCIGSPTTTKRDSTRVTDIPPKSSHDTVQAENVTTMPIVKSGENLASRVSSHLVLWIAAVSTTVLCLLDLIPI